MGKWICEFRLSLQKLQSKFVVYKQVQRNLSKHQRKVQELCKLIKHTNCFNWGEIHHLKVIFLNRENERFYGRKKMIFAKCIVCNHVLLRDGKQVECKRGCADSPWNKIKPEDLK